MRKSQGPFRPNAPWFLSVATVALLPEVLGLFPRQAVRLVLAEVTVVAGLEVPVDLGGDEGSEHFLGELVMDGNSLALKVVLVHPHHLEPDRRGEELMGDLVVRAAAAVDGVVGVLVVMGMMVVMPGKSHTRKLPLAAPLTPAGSAVIRSSETPVFDTGVLARRIHGSLIEHRR